MSDGIKKIVRVEGRFNISGIYAAGWGELNAEEARSVFHRVQESPSLKDAIRAFAEKGILVEFVGPIRCDASRIKEALSVFHWRERTENRLAVMRDVVDQFGLSGVEEQILRNTTHTPELY